MKRFIFYKQLNPMEGGITCLGMVARYYGRHYSIDSIRELAQSAERGTTILGLSEAAQKLGLRPRGVKITRSQLMKEATLPSILHLGQGQFVVLLPFNKLFPHKSIKVADPSIGIIAYSHEEFDQIWLNSLNEDGVRVGTALLLETTPKFFNEMDEGKKKLNWRQILQYFRGNEWQIAQVFIALLVTSGLQLIFPFLTQSIVDIGINTQNLQFITIILFAQLMLIFSRTVIDFILNRLLLEISIVINLSVLSDFWIKLTSLPLSYFESNRMGETFQRISDNKQIQSFLTGSAISTLFSLMNFIVFAIVLLIYNAGLFFIYLVGSALYFGWIYMFLGVRRKMNYQSFHAYSKENNATVQLIQGMQEIRLNNAEQLKRWQWENIQTSIFKLNYRGLNYGQLQQAGGLLINQGKDVIITFIVAKLVIEGKLSFGAMLAIQYIIGQLSRPIDQFVAFVQNAQDTKISMERVNEIHQLGDEEKPEGTYSNYLPQNRSIQFNDLFFTYSGSGNEPVLRGLSLFIPEGKITAIVGPSGSGKTTVLKLLLKVYDYYTGDIKLGESNFKNMSPHYWRQQCGSVLQDGFIFNDTIAGNIAVGFESPDLGRLIEACKMANILSFVESLPNGFNTQVGREGVGISQGQKQRLLIARAIYRDPKYLFFDESTNALDANNEKEIVENLHTFFQGRTVVIVAHRLSTVKNADKIVVLHDGIIAEEGTHHQLFQAEGRYYELVKNQMATQE